MHVAKRIAVALLVLPAAEIIVFLVAVAAFGFARTALAMIATSIVGALVLRSVGRTRLSNLRTSLSQRQGPGTGRGFFAVVGGILLLLPGFITDVLGLLLLLPPVQRTIGARVAAFFRGSVDPPADVIDLEPGEYRRHPDRPLPKPRRQRKPG